MSVEPAVLSVHAADTLGEEGVVVDRAVLSEHACKSGSAVTALLVAGPGKIVALEPLSLALVGQQLENVLTVLRPVAARTGILLGAKQVELVAEALHGAGVPSVVVAPVCSCAGARILDAETMQATRRFLYPLARVLVVRASETEHLSGISCDGLDAMRSVARHLRSQGARSALIAGGVSKDRVLDLLDEGGEVSVVDASRVVAPHQAGLAGAHAAALTGHLARGLPLSPAVAAAQRYVALRLQRGR